MLMRHVSLLDSLLPCVLTGGAYPLRLRYVLKAELLGDPCFDIVGNRLPNVFVRKGREADLAALRQLGQGLEEGEGVVIYPEGTRFTQARRTRYIARLKERGDMDGAARAEALTHLLPPVPAGTLALLEEMWPCDVLVIGHRGLEGAVRLDELWRGALIGRRVRVHVRRLKAEEVPVEPGLRSDWLYRIWEELHVWQSAEG